MKTKSIRIDEKLVEKLAEIKEANKLSTYNEALELIMPQGVEYKEETFNKELPAFTIQGSGSMNHEDAPLVSVSWEELKNCKIGDEWHSSGCGDYWNSITATVIFKDEYGVEVRFMEKNNHNKDMEGEYMNYYHFL